MTSDLEGRRVPHEKGCNMEEQRKMAISDILDRYGVSDSNSALDNSLLMEDPIQASQNNGKIVMPEEESSLADNIIVEPKEIVVSPASSRMVTPPPPEPTPTIEVNLGVEVKDEDYLESSIFELVERLSVEIASMVEEEAKQGRTHYLVEECQELNSLVDLWYTISNAERSVRGTLDGLQLERSCFLGKLDRVRALCEEMQQDNGSTSNSASSTFVSDVYNFLS